MTFTLKWEKKSLAVRKQLARKSSISFCRNVSKNVWGMLSCPLSVSRMLPPRQLEDSWRTAGGQVEGAATPEIHQAPAGGGAPQGLQKQQPSAGCSQEDRSPISTRESLVCKTSQSLHEYHGRDPEGFMLGIKHIQIETFLILLKSVHWVNLAPAPEKQEQARGSLIFNPQIEVSRSRHTDTCTIAFMLAARALGPETEERKEVFSQVLLRNAFRDPDFKWYIDLPQVRLVSNLKKGGKKIIRTDLNSSTIENGEMIILVFRSLRKMFLWQTIRTPFRSLKELQSQ